jgi:hypothetical protein
MCIVQGVLVQREQRKGGIAAVGGRIGGRGGVGGGLTKEDDERGRQTDRIEVIQKGSRQTVGEQSLGKDITRTRNGRGGEELPHTIIRREPQRPEMQNTGDGTRKGGREDREPLCKTKGRCGGLGVSYEKEARSRKDTLN